MRGGEGGGDAGSQPMSAHHVTWSPSKLWRSTFIFNLCTSPDIAAPVLMGPGLEVRAEREHLAVETRTKVPKGRARADFQCDLDGLDEILDVSLVGQDIVVQDGMVLPQGEKGLRGR
jgi:hypothetical protein